MKRGTNLEVIFNAWGSNPETKFDIDRLTRDLVSLGYSFDQIAYICTGLRELVVRHIFKGEIRNDETF